MACPEMTFSFAKNFFDIDKLFMKTYDLYVNSAFPPTIVCALSAQVPSHLLAKNLLYQKIKIRYSLHDFLSYEL